MTRGLLAWCLGITLTVMVMVAILHAPLASVETQFTVLKYRARGMQPADTNIVIIYIDNEAIRTLGWPVGRNFYAEMIHTLSALQVKAVGVETPFEEARPGTPGNPEYDDLLAPVIASSKDVVLASYFDVIGEEPDTAASDTPVPLQFNFPRVNGSLLEGKGLHLPLPRFLEGAAGVGHVNFSGLSSIDIPVLVHRGSGIVPAFAVEVLRLYCGAERSGLAYSDENVHLQSGSREIRFSTSSDAAVQLYLPNSFDAYTRYPFLEVLRAYEALRTGQPAPIPAMRLKDKLVLIGVIAEGRSEFRPTPVDPKFPSIGLHAAFIDNALHARFLRTTSVWLEYLLSFVLGFGGALAMLLLPSPLNKFVAFGSLVLVVLASFILFSAAAVQLPFAPVLTVGIVASMNALFLNQRLMRARLRSLQAERQTIHAQLEDREAKVALLERELLEMETAKNSDARADELFEEIRRYKAEIFTLSSRAGDLEESPVQEPGSPGNQFEGIVYDILKREGKGLRVSRNVMEILKDYPWRGNIGELENTIKRAVLLCRAGKRTMIITRDLGEMFTDSIRNAIPVQDQILELLRKKGFSRSSIFDTAGELGGFSRETVAGYLRGECLKTFDEQRFDIEATVRHVSLTAEDDVNDRVRKKLRAYLTDITDAVDVSQPWENSKASLNPKLKNLPERYHPHLEQVAEAFYRGLWKLDGGEQMGKGG